MRLQILSRDEFSCTKCGDDSNTLHVHHRYYIRNKDPWDYPEQILITLCENCHKNEEEEKEETQKLIYQTLLGRGFLNYDIQMLSELIEAEVPFKRFWPSKWYLLDILFSDQRIIDLAESIHQENLSKPSPFDDIF